ncbi:MAG TPA: ATP-binding protein [Candidatus Binataceae bacterium]|nr:ATP-binding protein [Candidatus Binataceae bacterium]
MFDRLMEYLGERGARRAAVLSGMRQVGKTELLKQIANALLSEGWPPSSLVYFDFADPRLPAGVTAPEVADIILRDPARGARPVLLLDEISKAANWGAWLKQAVDAQVGNLIITDSAASLIRDQAIESAPGRWDELRLEGLSFSEFLRLADPRSDSPPAIFRARPNSLERYLELGGFPEHVLEADLGLARQRLRDSIADKAIRFDLARLDVNTDRLRSFFVYLVQDSGAIFNARKRARDVDADERSIRRWVALLEDAHLVTRLDRYGHNAAARLRSKPRYYATDHGLIHAFTPMAPEAIATLRGRIIEAVVFRHLREAAREVGGQLSFFRDDSGIEADFVLDSERGRFVIQATASADPPARKLERLQKIAHDLGAVQAVVVQGGRARQPDQWRAAMPVLSLSLAEFLLDPFLVLGDRR